MRSPRSQVVKVFICEDVAVVRYDWAPLDALRFSLWLMWITLVQVAHRRPPGFTTTFAGPLVRSDGGPVPDITFIGTSRKEAE